MRGGRPKPTGKDKRSWNGPPDTGSWEVNVAGLSEEEHPWISYPLDRFEKILDRWEHENSYPLKRERKSDMYEHVQDIERAIVYLQDGDEDHQTLASTLNNVMTLYDLGEIRSAMVYMTILLKEVTREKSKNVSPE